MSKRTRVFLCENDPDEFCYVCGKYVIQKNKHIFTDSHQQKYEQYFGMAPENLDQQWAPSFICQHCEIIFNLQRKSTFGVPMIWKAPKCHATDCYLCSSNKSGFGKNMQWNHPTNSAIGFTLPVLHPDGIVDPRCLDSLSYDSSQESGASIESDTGSEFQKNENPKLLTQAELNDLVRDLELTKEKSELLASRLKERNFLVEDVSSTYFRDRHMPYGHYYTMENNICFCHDIPGLFQEMGQVYDA